MANRELDILRDALREHVNALAVDIGPRTPSIPDSLVRAANYIHSVFEDAGLTVSEEDYDYYDQRVTNLLATFPASAGASAYYVVGAHYDTVPSTPGADDNASAVAVLLELAGAGTMFGGNPLVLVPGVIALMFAVGFAATLGPARRGLAVQPTEALRDE